MKVILHGDSAKVAVKSTKYPGTDYHTKFEGIVGYLQKQLDTGSDKVQKFVKPFLSRQGLPHLRRSAPQERVAALQNCGAKHCRAGDDERERTCTTGLLM